MVTNQPLAPNQRFSGNIWLRWLNLRPEESGRTFLMFAFYTLTSVGILWLEVSVAALFLGVSIELNVLANTPCPPARPA